MKNYRENIENTFMVSVSFKNAFITLCIMTVLERLFENSKGEWARLLVRNLDTWLDRGHRQMNFYLTQVMSSHGALNTYLFHMKLAESPIALTAIEEGEMMTPGIPCLSVRHFDSTERMR